MTKVEADYMKELESKLHLDLFKVYDLHRDFTFFERACLEGNTEEVKDTLALGLIDLNNLEKGALFLPLVLAAYSSSADTVLEVLDGGINCGLAIRSALKLASYRGYQHVSDAIKNFISRSSIVAFAEKYNLEAPLMLSNLHRFICDSNIHPVRIAVNVLKYQLNDKMQQVYNVLNDMFFAEMSKGRANGARGMKYFFLSLICKEIARYEGHSMEFFAEATSNLMPTEIAVFHFVICFHNQDGKPSVMMKLFRHCLQDFVFVDSDIFLALVKNAANNNINDERVILRDTIMGPRVSHINCHECSCCGELFAKQRCPNCRDTYFCGEICYFFMGSLHEMYCKKNAKERTAAAEGHSVATNYESDYESSESSYCGAEGEVSDLYLSDDQFEATGSVFQSTKIEVQDISVSLADEAQEPSTSTNYSRYEADIYDEDNYASTSKGLSRTNFEAAQHKFIDMDKKLVSGPMAYKNPFSASSNPKDKQELPPKPLAKNTNETPISVNPKDKRESNERRRRLDSDDVSDGTTNPSDDHTSTDETYENSRTLRIAKQESIKHRKRLSSDEVSDGTTNASDSHTSTDETYEATQKRFSRTQMKAQEKDYVVEKQLEPASSGQGRYSSASTKSKEKPVKNNCEAKQEALKYRTLDSDEVSDTVNEDAGRKRLSRNQRQFDLESSGHGRYNSASTKSKTNCEEATKYRKRLDSDAVSDMANDEVYNATKRRLSKTQKQVGLESASIKSKEKPIQTNCEAKQEATNYRKRLDSDEMSDILNDEALEATRKRFSRNQKQLEPESSGHGRYNSASTKSKTNCEESTKYRKRLDSDEVSETVNDEALEATRKRFSRNQKQFETESWGHGRYNSASTKSKTNCEEATKYRKRLDSDEVSDITNDEVYNATRRRLSRTQKQFDPESSGHGKYNSDSTKSRPNCEEAIKYRKRLDSDELSDMANDEVYNATRRRLSRTQKQFDLESSGNGRYNSSSTKSKEKPVKTNCEAKQEAIKYRKRLDSEEVSDGTTNPSDNHLSNDEIYEASKKRFTITRVMAQEEGYKLEKQYVAASSGNGRYNSSSTKPKQLPPAPVEGEGFERNISASEKQERRLKKRMAPDGPYIPSNYVSPQRKQKHLPAGRNSPTKKHEKVEMNEYMAPVTLTDDEPYIPSNYVNPQRRQRHLPAGTNSPRKNSEKVETVEKVAPCRSSESPQKKPADMDLEMDTQMASGDPTRSGQSTKKVKKRRNKKTKPFI